MDKEQMNYNLIANRLAEAEDLIKELTQDEEHGSYHNDIVRDIAQLFKELQGAIECLSNLDK